MPQVLLETNPGHLRIRNPTFVGSLKVLDLSCNPLTLPAKQVIGKLLQKGTIDEFTVHLGAGVTPDVQRGRKLHFDATVSSVDLADHDLGVEDVEVVTGWVQGAKVRAHLRRLDLRFNSNIASDPRLNSKITVDEQQRLRDLGDKEREQERLAPLAALLDALQESGVEDLRLHSTGLVGAHPQDLSAQAEQMLLQVLQKAGTLRRYAFVMGGPCVESDKISLNTADWPPQRVPGPIVASRSKGLVHETMEILRQAGAAVGLQTEQDALDHAASVLDHGVHFAFIPAQRSTSLVDASGATRAPMMQTWSTAP